MRELTSSLLSFAWAQTLYTVQQIAQIGASMMQNPMQPSGPQSQHIDMPVAIGPVRSWRAAGDEIPVMMPDNVLSTETAAQPAFVQSAPPPQAPGWGPMP